MTGKNGEIRENESKNEGEYHGLGGMTEEITKDFTLSDEDWNCILMDCWGFNEDEKKTFKNCESYLKKFTPETIKNFEQIFQESNRSAIERAKENGKNFGEWQDSDVTEKELRLGMLAYESRKMNGMTYLKRIIGSLFHKIKEKIASLSKENQRTLVELDDSWDYQHQSDDDFKEIYQLFSLYNQIRDFLKDLPHNKYSHPEY